MMTHPLHRKAKKLASVYLRSEPMILETLMQMAEENLFIKMGFTGIWEYAVKELGHQRIPVELFSKSCAKSPRYSLS